MEYHPALFHISEGELGVFGDRRVKELECFGETLLASFNASGHAKREEVIALEIRRPFAGIDRGCVKTSARFHTSLFRSLLRGLRAFRVEKIEKNLALLDRLQNFAEFLHGLDRGRVKT
jgi:hypothetical protein